MFNHIVIKWCLKRGHIEFGGVNRLGDSGVNRLGDTSVFVNPAGQLMLTRQDKTRMDCFGTVFEFYIAPLTMLCLVC